MSFTHLQVRSGYSLFNSTITIPKLIKRAKELQLHALALTDEEVLYGVIPFYRACVQNGIKPLIGMVIHLPFMDHTIPCILLAKNNDGYKNLIQLSSHIQLENECTLSLLETLSDDLICIIRTETPFLKQFILQHKWTEMNDHLTVFRHMFSADDFYVGIEIYDQQEGNERITQMKQFQASYPIQLVALHDVRYLDVKDDSSYDCLQAMKHNKKWELSARNQANHQRHLRSQEEMKQAFSQWQELVDKTEEIVEKCHVTFDFNQQLLPKFPVPNNESASTYLKKLCMDQIPVKYNNVTAEVIARLDDELTIIEKLGFSDYFLIVSDFVQFAKENDIVVGPGRGSAAGSIVAYLLGITNVDPLTYELIFERFLNPERVTMPDIDIDFSDVRREEVIDYVREKYGQDHVAQIITFGTFAARSLLRELMKTMDINQHDQTYILKNIPVHAHQPIVSYINESKEFQTYIKQSKKLRMLFTIAIKLEGLPRHISTHAAGIVIGQEPLLRHVPLTKGSHDTYLTQYAMNELEAIGLLKIDILGLKNLSMMERIVRSVNRSTKQTIDVNTIPEDDAKTFMLLQAGKTNGVFQLESQGMKNVLMKLMPTSLEDIIAVNALYRPGPMENIPTYIERKHGHKQFAYIHPDLEPILHKTYGVLIYQEQIMQIAHQFAGLSLGEADILRRAVSKKERRLIDELKETFLSGCMRNGYDKKIAEEIFSWIIKFANYGFNKSHSVAYSKIAYQLSYLKANYPTYFFAHLLSSVSNEANKLNMYVREANELGIHILPPSINRSNAYFTVENNHIRVGLLAIKGIGYETVKEIMNVRKNRPFADLFDFCLRTSSVKRNALETLILAGAFDETYSNRASLLASIDQALERAELFGDVNGQGNLFGDKVQMKPSYMEMDDFSQVQKLSDEKELLHMYVTSHPIKQYRSTLTLQHFLSLQQAKLLANNSQVKTVVIVQSIKKIHTKRGDSMAFVTIADETEEMETVIFPTLYREISQWLQEEKIVAIKGKINIRQNKKQMVIDQMEPCTLEELNRKSAGNIYIKLSTEKDSKEALTYLRKTAQNYRGSFSIIIYSEKEKKTYKLGEKYTILNDENCMNQLKKYFGAENVVLKE